jgi:hypothetical protein
MTYTTYEPSESPNKNVVLVPNGQGETIAVALESEDLSAISPVPAGPVTRVGEMKLFASPVEPSEPVFEPPAEKTSDDYVFQFYMGSLTVVGLFILFRFIQKT